MQVKEVELDDFKIDIYSRKQRFVYRCLSMFGSGKRSIEDKRKFMDAWAGKLFVQDGFDCRVIFDETVWEPGNEEAYGNVCTLIVRGRDHTSYISEIDFRQKWHPVFDIKYVPKNDTED